MTHVTPKVVCVGVAGVGRDPERQALWQASVHSAAFREVQVRSARTANVSGFFGSSIVTTAASAAAVEALPADGSFRFDRNGIAERLLEVREVGATGTTSVSPAGKTF